MERYEAKIWECAIKTGLSQLQLWFLIKNNQIESHKRANEVRINYQSLRNWMRNHRTLIVQLRMDVDVRDSPEQVTRFMRKTRIKKGE